MPIYMNWGGGKLPEIRGKVTAAGHAGWIELDSAQFRTHAQPVNGGAGRGDSASRTSEILITKIQDIASTGLFKESLQGSGKTVVIDFVKTDSGKPEVYMTITLGNVLVSSMSTGLVAGRAMETISLNFTTVEYGPAAGVQPHKDPAPYWDLRHARA